MPTGLTFNWLKIKDRFSKFSRNLLWFRAKTHSHELSPSSSATFRMPTSGQANPGERAKQSETVSVLNCPACRWVIWLSERALGEVFEDSRHGRMPRISGFEHGGETPQDDQLTH